jgi:hypothetical protein
MNHIKLYEDFFSFFLYDKLTDSDINMLFGISREDIEDALIEINDLGLYNISINFKINNGFLNSTDYYIQAGSYTSKKYDDDGVNAKSTGSADFSPGYDPNNDANSSMDDTFNPNVRTKITNAEVLKSVNDVTNEFKNTQIGDFAKRLVVISRSQIGIVEVPKDSNTGPDVKKFQSATWLKGSGFAWCAAFVCWCFGEAANGITYNFKLPKTAGAWDFENWARSQGQGGVQILKPPFNEIKPGDIIIYKFSHIGIATSTLSGGKVSVVEGNTSASDNDPISKQREGGGVFKKSRSTSLIKTVLRIP